MKGSLRVHLLPVLILMCLCSTFSLAGHEDKIVPRDTHYFDDVSSWEDEAFSDLSGAKLSHETAVAKLRKDFPSLSHAEQVARIQQILAAQDQLYSKIDWKNLKRVSDKSSADAVLNEFKKILRDSQKRILNLLSSGDSQGASQVLDILAARQEAVDWAVAEEARLGRVLNYWHTKTRNLNHDEVIGFFHSVGVEAQKIIKKHEDLKKQMDALDSDVRLTAYRDSGRRQALESEYRVSLRKMRLVYEASKIFPGISSPVYTRGKELGGGLFFMGYSLLCAGILIFEPAPFAVQLFAGTVGSASFLLGASTLYSVKCPWAGLPGKDRSLLKKSLAGGSNLETEQVLAKLTEKLLASAVCRASGAQAPASTQRTRVRVAPVEERAVPVEVGVPESQKGMMRR